MSKEKHQLQIHLDHTPGEASLNVTFSYPFSGTHQLRPRQFVVPVATMAVERRAELDLLLQSLERRIPQPEPVRLPHATVQPSVRRTVATIVVQDQTQSYPVMRQYYVEENPQLGFCDERQVRMTDQDFTKDERAAFEGFRQYVKSLVWAEYTSLVQPHLH